MRYLAPMSRELINQYAEASREFQNLVSGIASGDLLRAPKAGEWSAGFVVHHMADADLHFTSRYLHAIGDINPSVVPFDEEAYPERVNYAMRKVKTSLAALVGIRTMAAEILANATDADWDKVSNHPELGPVTLSELFEKADGHIVAHTGQMREIAANF